MGSRDSRGLGMHGVLNPMRCTGSLGCIGSSTHRSQKPITRIVAHRISVSFHVTIAMSMIVRWFCSSLCCVPVVHVPESIPHKVTSHQRSSAVVSDRKPEVQMLSHA